MNAERHDAVRDGAARILKRLDRGEVV